MQKPSNNWLQRVAMLSVLVVLLSGSSCASQPLSSAVVTPAIPSLPSSARQPKTPPECEPTCSAGLERLLNSMLASPTSEE
ncbi:hypothetical protein D9M68_787350 [compost metagenome]